MSWGLVWAPAALRDFYDIPNWTTAARIDEAIGSTRQRMLSDFEDVERLRPRFPTVRILEV